MSARGLLLACAALVSLVPCARAVQPSARLAQTPEAYGLHAEAVVVRAVADSFALEGWWIAGPPHASALVMAGGSTGNRADLLPLARAFHDRGFAVLLFDYRDFGPQGPGAADTLRDLAYASRWVNDARGALAFARTRADSGAHVFGWGTDLGSMVMMASVAHDRGLAEGIVIDNPYRDTDAMLRHNGTAVIPDVVARHAAAVVITDQPAVCMARLRVPVLLALAGREDAPPAAMADELFRAPKTRVDRWLVPAATRAELLQSSDYVEHVTQWLRTRERVPLER